MAQMYKLVGNNDGTCILVNLDNVQTIELVSKGNAAQLKTTLANGTMSIVTDFISKELAAIELERISQFSLQERR